MGEVEGTVTIDGKPRAHLEVVFMPDVQLGAPAISSRAFTDENGRYRLAGDNRKNGATVGKHRVVITDLLLAGSPPPNLPGGPQPPGPGGEAGPERGDPGGAPPGSRGPARPAPSRSRVHPVYTQFSSTPLRQEVKSGTQTINLELKSKP